jgi:molecular chaperone DnaK (HSP70)
MAEDAGSVYSEVRLKLDNLTHDIMTVSKKFQTLGQNMIAGVNRPSEQVRKTIEDLTAKIQSNTQAFAAMTKGSDTKTYFKELNKAIKDAENANEAETWSVKQGEKEKAQALIKEISHWEKLKAAMDTKQAGLQNSEEAARIGGHLK